MPQRFGQSFFGDLASRLARLLELDGQVAPTVDIDATTVIVGGDATQPGYAGTFRGRQFAGTLGPTAAGVAGPWHQYLATSDCLIERLDIFVDGVGAGATLNLAEIWFFGASDTKFSSGANALGSLTERGVVATGERAPLVTSTGNAAGPAAPGQLIYRPRFTTVVGTAYRIEDPIVPFFLAANCAIVIFAASTNLSQLQTNVRGRVF